MKIHSYHYGANYDLNTSPQLGQIIDEDKIRELYSIPGNLRKTTEIQNIYQTPRGLVLAVTRIEPSQSIDNRATTTNKTYFVSLTDIAEDIKTLMNQSPQFPLKTLNVKLTQT